MRELKYLILISILSCFGCTGTLHLTDPIHTTVTYDAYPRPYHTTTYNYSGNSHYYNQVKWNYPHHHTPSHCYHNNHQHSQKKENNIYFGHRRK